MELEDSQFDGGYAQAEEYDVESERGSDDDEWIPEDEDNRRARFYNRHGRWPRDGEGGAKKWIHVPKPKTEKTKKRSAKSVRERLMNLSHIDLVDLLLELAEEEEIEKYMRRRRINQRDASRNKKRRNKNYV